MKYTTMMRHITAKADFQMILMMSAIDSAAYIKLSAPTLFMAVALLLTQTPTDSPLDTPGWSD
jgi:hypothetical protein